MKALVVGSNGTIGKAVTRLLKEKGMEVIEASRSGNPALDITDIQVWMRFLPNSDQ